MIKIICNECEGEIDVKNDHTFLTRPLNFVGKTEDFHRTCYDIRKNRTIFHESDLNKKQ